MLKFNLLEGINKILGFVITALLSRMLADKFGTYLYYQTIFTYLYATALFSTDYNFLVNYKIDKAYIRSTQYYQTVFVKTVLLTLVLLFAVIFLMPRFTEFAFWPYLLAVTASLFVYDFILYVEDDKGRLILFRSISQIATLAGTLVFYFKLADDYYITVIQILQTVILTIGTFWAARKYIPGKFSHTDFARAIRSLTPASIGNNLNYFLLRNFIVFFTTIEMVIFAFKDMNAERNIFAEGMRLSGILIPFVLFYINFNIAKLKKGYYTAITLIAILLLLASPVYVIALFGNEFIDKTYYYNFFIWVFIFNAFIEKDYIELLTHHNEQKRVLLIFNIIYFLASVLLFSLIFHAGLPLQVIIFLFSGKLLLYYLIFIKQFKLKLSYLGAIVSLLIIHVMNYALYSAGYYQFLFRQFEHIKHKFI